MTTWVSRTGLRLTDLVPTADRRAWIDQGHCPDRDLHTIFRGHVRTHPGRDAVIDPAGVVSYLELDAEVSRIAADLVSAGLGARDVIGIRLPNGRDAVATELAVVAIGAVALPYPGGDGSRDTRGLLSRAKASALIVDRVEDIDVTGLPDLTVRSPGRWGSPTARVDWSPGPIDPETPARILVSSGSESEPKMVAYSHNAFAGGRATYVRALHSGFGPMRNLVLVPLASSFGSCGVPVTIAALGGTLLVQGAFDPGAALRMITEHQPTHVFGVPTMLRRMADREPEPGEDTRGLVAMVASGAALPDSTRAAVRARFGRPVITVYGSADGVNCHTVDGRDGHVGQPDPAVSAIRVVDERGKVLPVGSPGEICARGPMTPLCYVAAPDLDTRYRLPGGWVRTGDLGVLDASGRLRVLGRIKQVVIRGGYNISPAEVEAQIGTHPAVAETACVGVPDDDLGERLCACIAQQPGSPPLTLPELTTFLHRDRGLERRKLPELLVVLPELPTGPTGKVCRRSLVELATGSAV